MTAIFSGDVVSTAYDFLMEPQKLQRGFSREEAARRRHIGYTSL